MAAADRFAAALGNRRGRIRPQDHTRAHVSRGLIRLDSSERNLYEAHIASATEAAGALSCPDCGHGSLQAEHYRTRRGALLFIALVVGAGLLGLWVTSKTGVAIAYPAAVLGAGVYALVTRNRSEYRALAACPECDTTLALAPPSQSSATQRVVR